LYNKCVNILLVWIGRLGDLLVSTPFMAAMRAKYPDARITLLARSYVRGARELLPFVDETVFLSAAPRDIAALAKTLLLKKFDLCVDMNCSYSRASGALTRLSGAASRVSFDKYRAGWFYTATVAAPREDEHMQQRYRRLADFFGAPFAPEMKISIPEERRRRAREILAACGVKKGDFTVAMHTGNYKKFDHRWPEEKFAELAKRISASGARVAYLCGPGEEAQVRRAAQMAGVDAILPPAELGLMAGILSEMNMLVVSATGTMHLAAAAGTPMISLHSGYTEKCWKPLQGEGVAVASKDWHSLRGITVDEVWQAYLKLRGQTHP